jgi:large subunit ribosomal protein L15
MFELNNLAPLVKKRKRIGRGGSRGGTSGRGNKGQKARTGHSRNRISFEGGQMPIVRRIPKRGFNNANFATEHAVINLSALEKHFENGDLVTKDSLIEKGLLKTKQKCLVKVLGTGSISKKLIVCVDATSKSASEKIIQSGGEVRLTQEM